MKHRRFHPASVYRLLLRLYPAGFREEYQSPMEQQFRDDFRSADSTRQRAMLWIAAVLDVVVQDVRGRYESEGRWRPSPRRRQRWR